MGIGMHIYAYFYAYLSILLHTLLRALLYLQLPQISTIIYCKQFVVFYGPRRWVVLPPFSSGWFYPSPVFVVALVCTPREDRVKPPKRLHLRAPRRAGGGAWTPSSQKSQLISPPPRSCVRHLADRKVSLAKM